MPAALILVSTLALLGVAAVPQTPQRGALDLYVSLDGHDHWSGLLSAPDAGHTDGPFATVHRAQLAVRAALAGSDLTGITVHVSGGLHFLGEPLEFTPEDSGRELCSVKWIGQADDSTILSAGYKIDGWEVGEDGRWRVTLPRVRTGAWNFAQLWVNDQRRHRPRLPEQGYYTIAEQHPPTEANAKRGHDRMGFHAGDLDPTRHGYDDVEVMAFHIWSASRMRIAAIDEERRVATFTGPTRTMNRWGAFLEGHRYFLDNVREALDDPGEWYLDRRRGELTYIPLPGETPEDTVVIAPRSSVALRLSGSADGRSVHDIEFRDLTFAHTNWTLPPQGQSYPQAEVHLGAAIEAVGMRNVDFIGCTVRHTGAYAFALGSGCQANRIMKCGLADLGAGGIKVGRGGGAGSIAVGGSGFEGGQGEVVGTVVSDCRIAHGGRLHPAAVGVWIGHASHTTVTHCTIRDFYYSGVSVGWTWGYAEPSKAHHNEISHNRISMIGQGVLSDMAGVYTLGVSPQTRIHHNVIEDVDAFDYGGWGLYTDEGSTGIEMTHNLVVRTKTGGFHQHYGRENVIANNIFVEARVQQIQRTRTEGHRSFTFERNIVYWTNESPLLGSNWRDDNFVLARNVYWNPLFKDVRFPGDLSLTQWREQRLHDEGSVVADPAFLDPKGDDFRLSEDSPAIPLGFEVWDLSDVGPRTPCASLDALPPVPAGFSR